MIKRSNILRRNFACTTALAAAIVVASPAAAQQMGNFGTVQSQVGPVTVTHAGNSLDVNAGGGAIVNWNSFDVAAGDAARFRNTGGAQAGEIAILNRVTGTRASRIDGTLTSDANVSLYLINPNGMVFGSGASVTVGSLTASTLDVTDADFLDGTASLSFSSADKGGKLDMGAAIHASGDLVVIGDDVAIAGNLEAQRDLGLIVAGAVTVQRAAGSPLKFTLTRGSKVTELQTSGSLTGRNVAIAAAADGSVTNRLLAMDSIVTATGIAATDKGINLVAGGGQSLDMAAVDASASGELTLQSAGRLVSAKGMAGASNHNLWISQISAQQSVRIKAAGDLDIDNLEVVAGDIELRQLYGSSGRLRASGTIDIYGETVTLKDDVAADRLDVFARGDLNTLGRMMNIDVNTLYVEARSIDLWRTNLSAGAASLRGDFVYLSNGGTFNVSGDLTIEATNNASLHNVNAGHLRLTAENVSFYDALTATQLDLFGGKVEQDRDATLDIGVLDGNLSGAVTLTGSNRIARIAGLSAASLSLNTASTLSLGGINNFSGNVSIKTAGDLIVGSGKLTGNQVSLASAGTFQNFAGAGAVTAADRWAIYLASPSGHYFGDLDSGNSAIWAGDVTSRPIGGLTGNRYVFASAPTLTFTPRDLAKVYGEDGAAQLATSYSVSGLHPGVANAFRGDMLADVVSGMPLLSSAGTAATATVAGGPYAIDISQGSLVSTAGYGLAFAGGGKLIVTPRLITATAHAADKVYDGTDLADGTLSLDGLLFGDAVTASGLFRFSDKNAGTGKAVTVIDAQLGGANAANYQLASPAPALASILRKQVQVSVAADDKTYDRTLAAMGRVTALAGVVAGDEVAFASGNFAFFDKDAGQGKIVTVRNLRFDGVDAGNYDFVAPTFVNASILPKHVTVGVIADDKTYDGTTLASGRVTTTGVYTGDEVFFTSGDFAFLDKNAGAGKQLRVSGITASGADVGNYEFVLPTAAIASILPKQVVVTIAADDKSYDQTLGATGRVTSWAGVLAGDEVAFASATFAFLDKNAGQGKAVTATDLRFGGADADNYDFVVPVPATASILPKQVTVGVMADNKIYDGTTLASGRITTTDGIYAGDQVFFTSGDFAFLDRNAGAGKQVRVSGISASGADSANYVVIVPLSTTAEIYRKRVDAIGAVSDKQYDGTTAALGWITGLDGLVAGDDLGISGGVFAFADANSGDGKAVQVTGLRLTGADADNYVLRASALRGNILKRAVTVRAVDQVRKPWEIGEPLPFTVTSGGLLAGDAFSGTLRLVPGGMPGRYRIDQGSLALSSNYALSFEPGTLTLTGGTLGGYQASRLYQELELGGRARGLRRAPDPIAWAAPLDCRDEGAAPCP
ncbi:YDG domain-containing protein [Sphingomonas psychrotolerans]|uniref:YDG domain-containing protein n=1 Tax=Sphingomonas psychrotolerans TaxID=1327635 RepID=A0ABU3N2Z2_9SPHN|nr:YDG domain-containing protein [Sphingomonas psychrotolerans]MDT8758768.1 YDG domain-containing protein [Sphingomonas psychrotolerans]